jgi:hypothetical protein
VKSVGSLAFWRSTYFKHPFSLRDGPDKVQELRTLLQNLIEPRDRSGDNMQCWSRHNAFLQARLCIEVETPPCPTSKMSHGLLGPGSLALAPCWASASVGCKRHQHRADFIFARENSFPFGPEASGGRIIPRQFAKQRIDSSDTCLQRV